MGHPQKPNSRGSRSDRANRLISACFVLGALAGPEDGEYFFWCAIFGEPWGARAALADFQGGFENCRDGDYAREFVSAHGAEAHGGKASATRTVRMAAELARSDVRLQVGRQNCGCERKNAILGTAGRRGELANDDLRHVELGILLSQLQHIGDGLGAFSGREDFGKVIADLRSEHAEPHFFDFGVRRPEFQKLSKIAGAFHHLSCHRAVDGDFLSGDVFQNASVGGGGTASVVFGLQAINGNDDVQARHVGPSGVRGTEGAGDDLHVDSTSEQLGNERLELAITNQGIAADER